MERSRCKKTQTLSRQVSRRRRSAGRGADALQDADAQPAEVPDVFPDADAQEDAKHYKL